MGKTAVMRFVLILMLLSVAVWSAPKPPAATAPARATVKAATPPTMRLLVDDEEVGQVWLSWDKDNLYVRYQIQDASPLQNSGEDQNLLFKSGDSVDLQLGLYPGGTAHAEPAEGDLRLLMTKTAAGPQLILYRYRLPGTQQPVQFASPTGRLTVDKVECLTGIKPEITVTKEGYTFAVTLPWAKLAGKLFTPTAGMVLRGDVGVLFSDPAGGVTVERIYWANKDTAIVADIPSEIRLHPDHWGDITLK